MALPLLPTPATTPTLRAVVLPLVLLLLAIVAGRQAVQLHAPVLRDLRTYAATDTQGVAQMDSEQDALLRRPGSLV